MTTIDTETKAIIIFHAEIAPILPAEVPPRVGGRVVTVMAASAWYLRCGFSPLRHRDGPLPRPTTSLRTHAQIAALRRVLTHASDNET